MPRLRIGRPEARQIVLAWLTFNWSTRQLEARFHYAPSTIKRLLRYWRRHQALPHDTRVRRRDARCLNRKEKRLIRRKVSMSTCGEVAARSLPRDQILTSIS